jgi:hypothetical protein
MSEKISLVYKKPILFGKDNNFISLGLMTCRGDKFLCFMDITTCKIYFEEVFPAQVNGEYIVGLKAIEEDDLWNKILYASNGYGLTSVKHIAENLHLHRIKINKTSALSLSTSLADQLILQTMDVLK